MKKVLIAAIAAALLLAAVLCTAGCVGPAPADLPGTSAADDEITETILNTFEELTKIPRPSHHEEQISDYLETHEYIMNADVRELCDVSAATANRILTELSNAGRLSRSRAAGHWVYRQIEDI